MNINSIKIERINSCTGIRIELHNANLVLIVGSKGYIMCSYLNMETAEKLGDVACIVTGVKTIEDVIQSRIIGVSKRARKLGIKEGMMVRDALKLLS